MIAPEYDLARMIAVADARAMALADRVLAPFGHNSQHDGGTVTGARALQLDQAVKFAAIADYLRGRRSGDPR